MGLNIAVFVPEGIVISSDSIAFFRRKDDGFTCSSTRTFAVWGHYLVSFIGNGFIQNRPYGYYMQELEYNKSKENITGVRNFIDYMIAYFKPLQSENEEHLMFYVAGCVFDHSRSHYELYLIDDEKVICLNKSNNNEDVYNYHVIGQSKWINKLLLPTTFKDDHTNVQEVFDAADSDFSKFSLEDAVNYVKFLMSLTYNTEMILQRRPMIDNNITIGALTLLEAKIRQ